MPRLPLDLEKVCLKALTKEPAGRYPTAAAMAADLRRFLRGEPVQARPLGWARRAVRRCRRKPGLAALWLSLVGVVVTSLAMVTWLWRAAEANRVQAEQALAASQRDQQRLKDQFAWSHEMAATLVGSNLQLLFSSSHSLMHNPDFLASAEKYYRTCLEHGRDYPFLDEERLLAGVALALLWQHQGRTEEALRAYMDVLPRMEQRLKEKPDSRSLHLLLINTLHASGQALWEKRERAAAWQHLQRARALAGPLLAREPEDASVLDQHFWVHFRMGEWHRAEQRPEQAFEELQRAGRSLERLQAAQRSHARHYLLIAHRVQLGTTLRDLGKYAEARKVHDETLGLIDHFFRDDPTPPDRVQQAVVQAWRGKVLMEQGRPEKALAAFEEAAGHFQALLHSLPGQPAYRRHLGACRHNAGRQLMAAQAFRQAVAIRDALAAEGPGNWGDVSDLGGSYHRLAQALEKSNQAREALCVLQCSVAQQRKLCTANPADDSPRRLLRTRLLHLARLHLQLGQARAAFATLAECR